MVDGYTSAERSANAKKQLRDKKGRWIEMGATVRFLLNGKYATGKVTGISPIQDSVTVETPDGMIHKQGSKSLESIGAKASLNVPSKPAPAVSDPYADLVKDEDKGKPYQQKKAQLPGGAEDGGEQDTGDAGGAQAAPGGAPDVDAGAGDGDTGAGAGSGGAAGTGVTNQVAAIPTSPQPAAGLKAGGKMFLADRTNMGSTEFHDAFSAAAQSRGISEKELFYAVEKYTNPGGFHYLQNYLRTGDTKGYMSNDTAAEWGDDIRAAVGAATVAKKTTLYRGIHNVKGGSPVFKELLEQLKPGAIITEKGVMSTSPDAVPAAAFANKVGWGGILLEFDIDEGDHALDIAGLRKSMNNGGGDVNLNEFLLSSGRRIRVDSFAPHENDQYVTHVKATLLPAEEKTSGTGQEDDTEAAGGVTPSAGEPAQGDSVAEPGGSGGGSAGPDVVDPGGVPGDDSAGGRVSFADPQKAKATLDAIAKKHGLTPSKLHGYLNDYGSWDWYRDMNRLKRIGFTNKKDPKEIAARNVAMEDTLDALTVDKPTAAYRGVRFGPGGESTPLTDAIEKAIVDGGVLVDPAFLSTSTNKKRSEQYASKNAANGGYLIEMTWQPGDAVMDMQAMRGVYGGSKGLPNEWELTGAPGTGLKFTSIEPHPTIPGVKLVKASVIPAQKNTDYASMTPQELHTARYELEARAAVASGAEKTALDTELKTVNEALDANDKRKVFEVLDRPGPSGNGFVQGPGHKLWGRHGASGVLARSKDENGNDRFLLMQRALDGSKLSGKWQLPGGALNGFENDYQAAARELSEELSADGAAIAQLKPVADQTSVSEGTDWHYTSIMADSPEMFDVGALQSSETNDAKWLTADELSALRDGGDLHPALVDTIDGLLEKFNAPTEKSETEQVDAAEGEELASIEDPKTEVEAPDVNEFEKLLSATDDTSLGDAIQELKDGGQDSLKAYGDAKLSELENALDFLHNSGAEDRDEAVADFITAADTVDKAIEDVLTNDVFEDDSAEAELLADLQNSLQKAATLAQALKPSEPPIAEWEKELLNGPDDDDWASDLIPPASDLNTAPAVPTGTIGTDKSGNKYVSDANGDPIYKGSTVKSLKDGLTGEVKTLEGNGAYVKVIGPDGKVKGRKITTLEVQDGAPAEITNAGTISNGEIKTEAEVPPALMDADGNELKVGDTVGGFGEYEVVSLNPATGEATTQKKGQPDSPTETELAVNLQKYAGPEPKIESALDLHGKTIAVGDQFTDYTGKVYTVADVEEGEYGPVLVAADSPNIFVADMVTKVEAPAPAAKIGDLAGNDSEDNDLHVGDVVKTYSGQTVKVVGKGPKDGYVKVEYSNGATANIMSQDITLIKSEEEPAKPAPTADPNDPTKGQVAADLPVGAKVSYVHKLTGSVYTYEKTAPDAWTNGKGTTTEDSLVQDMFDQDMSKSFKDIKLEVPETAAPAPAESASETVFDKSGFPIAVGDLVVSDEFGESEVVAKDPIDETVDVKFPDGQVETGVSASQVTVSEKAEPAEPEPAATPEPASTSSELPVGTALPSDDVYSHVSDYPVGTKIDTGPYTVTKVGDNSWATSHLGNEQTQKGTWDSTVQSFVKMSPSGTVSVAAGTAPGSEAQITNEGMPVKDKNGAELKVGDVLGKGQDFAVPGAVVTETYVLNDVEVVKVKFLGNNAVLEPAVLDAHNVAKYAPTGDSPVKTGTGKNVYVGDSLYNIKTGVPITITKVEPDGTLGFNQVNTWSGDTFAGHGTPKMDQYLHEDDFDAMSAAQDFGPGVPAGASLGNVHVGSIVSNVSKGYTGTVQKIEGNQTHAKVFVNETGKVHGLAISKLSVIANPDGSKPVAVKSSAAKPDMLVTPPKVAPKHDPSGPEAPEIDAADVTTMPLTLFEKSDEFSGAPSSADDYNAAKRQMPAILHATAEAGPDKRSPLYGAPEPKPPAMPAPPPKLETPFVNDAWIQQAKQRYLDNPNKAKPSLEASANWHKFMALKTNGDPAILNNLIKHQYITEEMKADALKQIAAVNAERAVVEKLHTEILAEHDKKLAEFKDALGAWRKANGIAPIAGGNAFPGMPETSTKPFYGGEPDWTAAHPGTVSLATALPALYESLDLARAGVSVLVDRASVEDMDMRLRHVTDKAGNRLLEVEFKLTAAIADKLDDQLRKQGAPKDAKVRIPIYEENPETGLLKRTGKTKYSADGWSYKLTAGEATIEFNRTATKTQSTNEALHNTTKITLPAPSAPEKISVALEKIGVTPAPATEGDLRVYAENKIMSIFGTDTDPTHNKSGEERQKLLNEAKTKWGVTPDDLIMAPDTHGRNKFFLTDEIRDKLVKDLKLGGFRHSISDLSTDAWVNFLTGPTAGLSATHTRWGNGVLTNGMSSSSDMASGGADYIFSHVSHDTSSKKTEAYAGTHVFINPYAAMRRTDVYANASDSYGRRKPNVDIYEMLKGAPHETMFKHTVPVSDISYIVIPGGSSRAALLKALKSKGTYTINGVPVDEFILPSGGVIPTYDPALWSTPVAPTGEGAAPSV